MTTFHAIDVRVLPATNTKPARVRLISHRYGWRRVIPHCGSCVLDSAVSWLAMRGFTDAGFAETARGWIVLSTTFKHPED
jgi:hypothetical protein